MPNIQNSPYPLVFKAANSGISPAPAGLQPEHIQVRTSARALEGMQKEAIVEYPATGTRWRMVCDEGPYLNGTDLAPFPLGFFAAGLAASFMSAFIAEAVRRDIRIDSLSLTQDNYYTMQGSALRGTMVAGVKSVDVYFTAAGSTSSEVMLNIAATAMLSRSPASACLRAELPGTFAIVRNGEALAPRERGTVPGALPDPAAGFDNFQPVTDVPTMADIITKSRQDSISMAGAADPVGLQADQNRIVHVHTQAQLREDGIKAITAQCVQPVSTAFTFLSDDSQAVGGRERAPSGLAYLSCGVAFCFMTQLGRYAQIAKQRMNGYRIVQETGFGLARTGEASADPVRTQVSVDTEEDAQATQKMVAMGEQTCYLHASYRQSIPIRFKCTN